MKEIISLLHSSNCSCVIKNHNEIRIFHQRGIADLYNLLQNDFNFLNNAIIADKVIGKGAAALMILGKIQQVYADVISNSALQLLTNANIEVNYIFQVPFIQNRDKSGWCPVEKICETANTAEEILPLIKQFVTSLKSKNE